MRGCVWFEGFRVSLPPAHHGGLRFDEHVYASFVCIMYPPTEYGECVYCKIANFLQPARNSVLQSITLHMENCMKIYLNKFIPDHLYQHCHYYLLLNQINHYGAQCGQKGGALHYL